MKLYLDDIREPQDTYRYGADEWFKVETVEEMIAFLEEYPVEEVSLDHDLGPDEQEGKRVLVYFEEKIFHDETYVPPYVNIHTANASVRKTMEEVARRMNWLREKRLGGGS